MTSNTAVVLPMTGGAQKGLTFVDAVKTALRKSLQFSGRAPRKEFGSFILFVLLTVGGTALISVALASVLWIAFLIPYWSVAARRLHDTGNSGWSFFFSMIPLIGPLVVSYLLFFAASQDGVNKYGPHPYANPALS